MSYTEIYRVTTGGRVEQVAELRNAFRGAFLIWERMSVRYLGRETGPFRSMQPVWDLWKDVRIPVEHRIVLAFTFDWVAVRRRELGRFIGAIERFGADFEDPGTIVEQPPILAPLALDKRTMAVCWNQTSVNCDMWRNDRGGPYNFRTRTRHWWLFDEYVLEQGG